MGDISVKMKLTENVSTKMKKIVDTTKEAATSLDNLGKNIDKAFRSNAAEAFESKAGKAIETVSDEAENLGDKLEKALNSFRPSQGDIIGNLSGQLEDAAGGADDFSDTVEKVGDSVEKMAKDVEGLGEKIKDTSDGIGEKIKETKEEIGKPSEIPATPQVLPDYGDPEEKYRGSSPGRTGSLAKTIKGVVAAVAGLKVVGEVRDFLGDTVSIGKDFTSMMSEVQSISGASGNEIAKMEETARSYGATTVFSATEAAEALKYMSLAGWNANQSSSALGGVLNLAAASGMELGQASDMVTDYLSAFGMQAGQASYFADMLSYAQSKSNTTAAQLGEAYRNSAANMHAAGQDVETTTSFLEAMANQGYKGSEAGTALAATMRDITQKMEDGAIKIGDTSVAVQDSKGNFRDLTDVMADVESATSGMGDAQKAAALGSTFTADSIKAINMILAEGMDKVSGYEDALRSAGGTAEAMAGTMNDNLTGDMANMNSAFEEMKLQIFDHMEGPLRSGVQYVTGTIIPTLTDWVPEAIDTVTAGVGAFASATGPLFETLLKNPKAVVEAIGSITAGFAAFKTVTAGLKAAKFVKEAGGITSALAKLSGGLFGSPWAAGAAAVTAAVAAVGFALHEYNKLQIEDSLASHFGDIELSAAQIESAAGHILNTDWLVNVETSLGKVENADNLAKEAEQALAKNDALEWKCAIGIELTPDEQTEYSNNIQDFVTSQISELEDRTYAARISFSILPESEEKTSFLKNIDEWAAKDIKKASKLQAKLTRTVEAALTDGIIDADEEKAINELQQKMNNVLAGWKEAEAQAEMDWLSEEYSGLSGKDLSSGAFKDLVKELGKQRETAKESLKEEATGIYGLLNGFENSGRITEEENEYWRGQVGQVSRDAQAGTLAESLNFESGTLSDAYGDKLDQNYAAIQERTSGFIANANNYLENADYDSLYRTLQKTHDSVAERGGIFNTGFLSDGDQGAVSELYETMKPDVEATGALIDQYRAVGQAVPEEAMKAYNEAMKIGAAAGDADAAWHQMAMSLVTEPASQQFEEAILAGTASVPEGLKTAVERITADTTGEVLTFDGLSAKIENLDVDSSNVGKAVDEATKTDAAGDAIEVEKPVNVKTKAGENDESGAVEAGKKAEETAQSAAGGDTTVEQTVTTNKKYVPGNEDTSQVTAATEQALQQQTIDSKATVDVTAQPGTDNFAEVAGNLASKFSAAVKAAFAKTFTATTNVSITANYSLANPTKTISFSGGGSGTATVKASMHAAGGIFHEPHLGMVAEAGYPESVIPIDGSPNAIGLWQKTGEMLGLLGAGQGAGASGLSRKETDGYSLTDQGLFDQKITTMPAGMGVGTSDTGQKDTGGAGGDRTINININGSGRMQVSSNMSKDDVVSIILDTAKDAIYKIVEQEIMEEGDLAYDY